jgi:hypothetical protein
MRPLKPWKEALVVEKVLDDGSVYIDLQPGNGTRYPIVVNKTKIPNFGGVQVMLLWHSRGWRSYVFHSKPDVGYLMEKWNFEKMYEGDLTAILNYWDEIIRLVE